jgi:acyl-coenzyme A synthetase/AMP-(fatty) acid ligase
MALTREPLPRNANGKVIKRQLRERLAASLSAERA